MKRSLAFGGRACFLSFFFLFFFGRMQQNICRHLLFEETGFLAVDCWKRGGFPLLSFWKTTVFVSGLGFERFKLANGWC